MVDSDSFISVSVKSDLTKGVSLLLIGHTYYISLKKLKTNKEIEKLIRNMSIYTLGIEYFNLFIDNYDWPSKQVEL